MLFKKLQSVDAFFKVLFHQLNIKAICKYKHYNRGTVIYNKVSQINYKNHINM